MRSIDPQLLRREIQAAEHGGRFVAIEPAAHGGGHRFGLLEDLLEHEVRKAAEFDLRRVDVEQLHVVAHVAFVAVDDADRLGRDHREFVVGQVDDAIGVSDERRAVAGDEVLAVADADHQRAAQPGGDDHVRPIAEHHRQAVGAAELGERRLNGSDERRVGSAGEAASIAAGRASSSAAISCATTSVSVADLQ